MKSAAWLLLGAVLLGACGVPVSVESDPAQRRPAWKTWSWLSRPPVAQGDVTYASIDERMHASFEREMAARGFRRVEREKPDFLITYYAAVEKPIRSESIAYAAGGPSPLRAVFDATGAYAQGTLIVDVLDPRTGKLVWRGVGGKVFLPEQDAEQRRARIDDAVDALVSEFSER
jgi:hypothetical protein